MSGAQIVVVGSVNADLVVSVDRRPAAGETILGGPLRITPGGKGANQAVAAALLGARVAFVGRTGDDAYGLLLRTSLTRAGVDLANLAVAAGPTGVALITVTPDGDNSIIVSPGANALVTTDDIQLAAPLLTSDAVLVLQLELPLPVVAAAVRAARAVGARVILNLAPAATVDPDILASCDPLIVNEHEAAFLLGAGPGRDSGELDPAGTQDEWGTVARRLLDLGPRSVVVTLGGSGAVVATADLLVRVPATRVEVVDTTGAGDAFVGALAWRLAAGDDLVTAAGAAVRVATVSVTRPGAQPSYPSIDDPSMADPSVADPSVAERNA